MQAIEKATKIQSISGGGAAAIYPLFHPINTYYVPDYEYPENYLSLVKTPMCYGRILEKLIERVYDTSISEKTTKTSSKSKSKSKNKGAVYQSPFMYYYETNTVQEILSDIQLIRENIVTYNAPVEVKDVSSMRFAGLILYVGESTQFRV